MKYTSSIVVCALLGFTSAENLNKAKWVYEGSKADFGGVPAYNSEVPGPYSNQIANGDKSDDKQLENERDVDDDIVQDNGFGLQAKLFMGTGQQNMNLHRQRHAKHRESDHLANGDATDDHQVESENDPSDDVVQDTGFGSDARLWALHQRKAHSLAQKHHHHHAKRYSDELANGDKSDDKENIDENDPTDPFIQDTGFGTDARLWTLHQKRANSYAQKHHQKHHQHHAKRYSDELANGDKSDDKENIDENDPTDPFIQDTGFGTDARLWTLHQRNARSFLQTDEAMHMTNQMKEKMIEIGAADQGNGDYDTLSNTDWNDNRQVEDENDPEDPLVQDTGFGTQASLWKGTSLPDAKAIEKAFIKKHMVV